ncbi:MAG: radical SAM protein, partial [Patescibacteria group bacterium]
LKSFDEKFYQGNCNARLKPVLENLKSLKKAGVWVEITTLIIPTLSDSEKMLAKIAKFIKEKLGPETPWHLSQFSGAISWQLQNLAPTPKNMLERACQLGREAGLHYVYAGNIESKWNNTFCPQCRILNIERNGYLIKRKDKKGRCYVCNTDLDIIE